MYHYFTKQKRKPINCHPTNCGSREDGTQAGYIIIYPRPIFNNALAIMHIYICIIYFCCIVDLLLMDFEKKNPAPPGARPKGGALKKYVHQQSSKKCNKNM